MGKVTIRTSVTSQGGLALSSWRGNNSITDYLALNLGNNPNSRLEVVSWLNVLNLGHSNNYYNTGNCVLKYNPKVYLSAVHTASYTWNYDAQKDQTNGLPDLVPSGQKSGSWPCAN